MDKSISFEEFQHQMLLKNKIGKEVKVNSKNDFLKNKTNSPVKFNKFLKNDFQREFKPILSSTHEPISKNNQPKSKSIENSIKNNIHNQIINKKISPEKNIKPDKQNIVQQPNKEELLEFQQKTVSRLIDRRREYKETEQNIIIMDKKGNNDIRQKRKEKMKSKTMTNISDSVDKQIFENTLLKSPELVLDFKMSEIYNEKLDFENIILDLMADVPINAKDLSPSEMLNGLPESPTTRSSKISSFLNNNGHKPIRSTTTGFQSDNDSLFSIQENNNNVLNFSNSAGYKYLQKTVKLDMSVDINIDGLNDQNIEYNKSFPTTCDNYKPFSSNLPTKRFEKNNVLDTLTDNDKTFFKKKIKSSGLMAQFIDNNFTKDRKIDDTVYKTRSNTSSLNDAAISPRNSILRSSSFNAVHVTKPMSSDISPQNSKTSIYSSLVDNVFLVGPSKNSIDEFIKNRIISNNLSVTGSSKFRSENEKTEDNSINKSLNFNDSFFDNSNNIIDIDTFLTPEILFATDSDNPLEMLSLLPAYCYPSNAAVTVTSENISKPPTKSLSQKRKSLLMKSSSLVSQVASAVNKSPSSIQSPEDNDGGRKYKRRDSINRFDHLVSKSQFILIFGDQTYQQYGLCLRIPIKHYDYNLHVVVNTSYVICLMTKVPFFNYIYDILTEFDSVFHGFKFNDLLSVQDSLFPIQSELKLINELALRLKKISVPLYSFILNKSKNTQSSDTSVELFSHLYEPISVVPDINFSFSGRHKKTFESQFKRNMYQSFYSDYLSSFNIKNDLDVNNIINNLQMRNIDFIPDFQCKNEKEKEDSFMILLWALPVLLKYLPLDQIILALGCAVTEMKIVVKHTDVNVISTVILALIHLLRPLKWKWSLPVIILLPDNLSEDILDSPFPIIVGLQKLPDSFLLQERVVVIDPLERIVHLNPIDVVLSHTILLPHASKLVHALRSPTETILKLSKKKKFKNEKKTVISTSNLTSQEQSSTANLASAVIDKTEESKNPVNTNDTDSCTSPPPLSQLSANSDSPSKAFRRVPSIVGYQPTKDESGSAVEYNSLLSAIKSFTSLVYNHIQAIVNTAILLKYEERQSNRLSRRVLINPNITPRPKKPSDIDKNDGIIKAQKNQSLTNISPIKKQVFDKIQSPSDWMKPRLHNSPKEWNISQRTNSLHDDDNYSEITFTDSMAGKTETHDIDHDNKENNADKSNSSVCSDSSSLPTLQKNAPMLGGVKEIGESGMKFIKKLLDTQMFSNYCQTMKKAKDSSTNLNADFNVDYDMTLMSPEEKKNDLLKVNSNNSLLSNCFNPRNNGESGIAEELEELDSITSVFEIMLTGTIPISENILKNEMSKYSELYKDKELVDPKIILSKYSKVLKESSKLGPDSYGLILSKYMETNKQRMDTSLSNETSRIDGSVKDLFEVNQSNLWCNGLVCRGLCNTPYCTEICLNLWQVKIKKLRQQAVFKDIVTKHKYSSLVLKNHMIKLPDNKKVVKISVQPKLDIIKHNKETESQYMKRRDIKSSNIRKDIDNLIVLKDPKGEMKSKQLSMRNIKSIYGPKDLRVTVKNSSFQTTYKKVIYANKSTCDLATLKIAQYYSLKQIKIIKKNVKKAFITLKKFLYKYVCLYRKIRFIESIIKIQSFMRGFYVRSHIAQLIEALIDRKLFRLLACIRIRRFIRCNETKIYFLYQKRKFEKFRAKRATISIPVPDVKSIRGLKSNNQLSDISISTTGSRDRNSITPISSLYNGNLSSLSKELPPIDPNSKFDIKGLPNNSSPISGRASYFNNPSFTEKAREFLQFGKILPNRSSINSSSGSNLNSTNRFTNPDRSLSSSISTPINNQKSDSSESKIELVSSETNDGSNENKFVSISKDITINDSINYSLSKSGSPSNLPILDCIYESSDEELEQVNTSTCILQNNEYRQNHHRKQYSNSSAADSVQSAITSSVKSNDSFNEADIENKNDRLIEDNFRILSDDVESLILSNDLDGRIENPQNNENIVSGQLNVFSDDPTIYSHTFEKKLTEPTISGTFRSEDNLGVRNKVVNKKKNNSSILDDIISRSRPINIPRHPSASSLASNGTNDISINSGKRNFNLKINTVKNVAIGDSKFKISPLGRYAAENNIAISKIVSNSTTIPKPNGKGIADFNSPLNNNLTEDILSFQITDDVKQALSHHLDKNDDNGSKKGFDNDIGYVHSNRTSMRLNESVTDSEKNNYNKSNEDEEEDDDDDEVDDNQINNALKIAPLKTLGPDAMDYLTPQQLHSLVQMWNLLRSGEITVLKHGRSGKPKQRTLFCDVNMTKLYWRSVGSKIDVDMDNEHDFNSSSNYHRKDRRSSTFTKSDSDRVIYFKEILEIRDDYSTEVMKRSLAKNYLDGNRPTCIISILLVDRTLDFEIEEEYWGSIYHAIQILIYFYSPDLQQSPVSLSVNKNKNPIANNPPPPPTTNNNNSGNTTHHLNPFSSFMSRNNNNSNSDLANSPNNNSSSSNGYVRFNSFIFPKRK